MNAFGVPCPMCWAINHRGWPTRSETLPSKRLQGFSFRPSDAQQVSAAESPAMSNTLIIGLIVFVAILAGAIAGATIRTHLPKDHAGPPHLQREHVVHTDVRLGNPSTYELLQRTEDTLLTQIPAINGVCQAQSSRPVPRRSCV
jgi:hypothetical protein